MAENSELRIQKWGNSLAVRIPAVIAKRAGFHVGQPVRLSLQDASVLVSSAYDRELTLKQRLALFDPDLHGGEAMLSLRTGMEVL